MKLLLISGMMAVFLVAASVGHASAAASACPVHVLGKRIVDPAGRTVYTDPGYQALSNEIRCSGRVVWVMFLGGAASSQQAYVIVRAADNGVTWKLIAAESYFGVKAPHEFDAYAGPWTIDGESRAYFTGSCPACGYGTVSLWATHDGGRTFHRYALRSLTGFWAKMTIRVSGETIAVSGRSTLQTGPRWRTETVTNP